MQKSIYKVHRKCLGDVWTDGILGSHRNKINLIDVNKNFVVFILKQF